MLVAMMCMTSPPRVEVQGWLVGAAVANRPEAVTGQACCQSLILCGLDEANKYFACMNPSNVVGDGNGVRVRNLEDGRRALIRPNSSNGRPTIEIQRPDGKIAGDKLH